MMRYVILGICILTFASCLNDGSIDSHKKVCKEKNHLTGSFEYTCKEQIMRDMKLAEQVTMFQNEADELGIPKFDTDTNSVEPEEPVFSIRDFGGFTKKKDLDRFKFDESDAPCCTEKEIKESLIKIKLAYAKIVASTKKWKGCQDWATKIDIGLRGKLAPCFEGKYVWRMSITFGFTGNSTFLHHAYAIFPCNAKSASEGLVLDPYDFIGFSSLQFANIYPFNDWVAKGAVFKATSKPDHENGDIYSFVYKMFKTKSAISGGLALAECRILRKLLIEEYRRYSGQSGQVFDEMIKKLGLDKDNCKDL